MSASFAYDSPVRSVRDLRRIWRIAAVTIVVVFSISASLIVNDALSPSRAVLIGIAAFSAAWAATVLVDPSLSARRGPGASLLVGTTAGLVALLATSATAPDDVHSRTVMAVVTLLIAILVWLQSVVQTGNGAHFEASVGTLALLTTAVGLIMLPTRFEAEIASDAGGLLIAAIAPLTAALLISRHSRRGLIVLALIAIVGGVLREQPADMTGWVIAGTLVALLLVANGNGPSRTRVGQISFTSIDAVLLTGTASFLAIYLAFSIGEHIRGFLMGSIGVMVIAASLIQRLIISERDERMAELARMTAEIRERARLDPLTGLPNRAALDARLEEEVERAVRYRHPMSLCFIDIDHFKAINDTRGHQVGDEILRSVSRVVRATVRTPDFVARYGGEEFVVIAPGTWTEDAAILGHRIQAAIADQVPQPIGSPVTVSIGIAGVPEHGRDPATILKVADLALYAAKYAGRNRVEIGFVDAPLVSP